MDKRVRKTQPVQVDAVVKSKVAKKVAGTCVTIGEFYTEAAKEKLAVGKVKIK